MKIELCVLAFLRSLKYIYFEYIVESKKKLQPLRIKLLFFYKLEIENLIFQEN